MANAQFTVDVAVMEKEGKAMCGVKWDVPKYELERAVPVRGATCAPNPTTGIWFRKYFSKKRFNNFSLSKWLRDIAPHSGSLGLVQKVAGLSRLSLR